MDTHRLLRPDSRGQATPCNETLCISRGRNRGVIWWEWRILITIQFLILRVRRRISNGYRVPPNPTTQTKCDSHTAATNHRVTTTGISKIYNFLHSSPILRIGKKTTITTRRSQFLVLPKYRIQRVLGY